MAARVLASQGHKQFLLSGVELWDVLRWYAHNRGYDGNRRWSSGDGLPEEEDDTEKVENARALLTEYGTATMAETIASMMFSPHCRRRARDIPVGESLPFFTAKSRYKARNAAFPRDIVEAEVRKLLNWHIGHLPGLTPAVIAILCDHAREVDLVKQAGISLPKRYDGGLLFGQFVPRFDNRIIGTCPVSGKKVPSKQGREFFLYRWLIQLANVRVVRPGGESLTKEERLAIHSRMMEAGGFTKGAFKTAVRDVTGCRQDNLDTMLMHPDAEKALTLDPARELIHSARVQYLWPHLPERIRKRAAGKWHRGAVLTLRQILGWCDGVGSPPDQILAAANATLESRPKPKGKGTGKAKGRAADEQENLDHPLKAATIQGRAPYHREVMSQACTEILDGFDPRMKCRANDPRGGEEKSCDGILVRDPQTVPAGKPFPSLEEWRNKWARKPANISKGPDLARAAYEAARQSATRDARTNNHLVRHRLLILQRLIDDIISDPTLVGGRTGDIQGIAVEVNRELKEFSGSSRKEIEKELGLRLGNFKSVIAKLRDCGIETPSAGLIRKARVAADLNWTCPYTGRGPFQPAELLDLERWDKDHIIPFSQRPSNSLDSLVITSKAVNLAKKNRTALQFIEEMNLPENHAERDRLGVWTVKQFRDFVDGLEAWKGHDDDKRRKRRRKQLLLLPKWEEKDGGFLPRDLTVTSHLTRLAATSIQQATGLPPHLITSLPGSVTAAIRNGWDLRGTLQAANPGVIDKQTGTAKTKTEIRGVTHLHHALDAIVIALTHHYFPKNGRLWEAMVRRDKQRNADDNRLLLATGLYVSHQQDGKPVLSLARHMPPGLEKQIRARLAERRVVQHLPADMSGMIVEENTRGVERIDPDGTVHLRQYSRDEKTGKLTIKRDTKPSAKVIGLLPGKLKAQRGVRVIKENYGVAILDQPPAKPDGTPGHPNDRFVVIPFANVWKRLRDLRAANGGKMPVILRQGSLIEVPAKGKGAGYRGAWMIRGIADKKRDGIILELCWPDVINSRESGVAWTWPDAALRSIWIEGQARVLPRKLTGAATPASA